MAFSWPSVRVFITLVAVAAMVDVPLGGCEVLAGGVPGTRVANYAKQCMELQPLASNCKRDIGHAGRRTACGRWSARRSVDVAVVDGEQRGALGVVEAGVGQDRRRRVGR